MTHLPKPCGYQVLVKMQVPVKITPGGLHLPPDTQDAEAMKKARGQVVALGPDAYHGTSNGAPRFPSGPYCEVGDWIEWNRYQERRIHIGDEEYAFVHDDRVLGNWGKSEPGR